MFDIIFISYNENEADENYANLKSRFGYAKRVHGVEGIHKAHIEAAKIAVTEMFWIVDADAVILDSFDFTYTCKPYDEDIVHVWRCKNPINDLTYGYGGVKLFPRRLTLKLDVNSPDMTTSISTRFRSMPQVSNITAFNTDPFNTWRSGFRGGTKMASGIIDHKKQVDGVYRLEVWCTRGENRKYGEYAMLGAQQGKEFGTHYKGNTEALRKINDWEWLRKTFNEAL